jgi:hypothetical protein
MSIFHSSLKTNGNGCTWWFTHVTQFIDRDENTLIHTLVGVEIIGAQNMLKLVSLGLETQVEIAAVSLSSLAGCSIRDHGALCRPVSPGGRKIISVPSVIQLSARVPRYVLANFLFCWSINAWFIIIYSGPRRSESLCSKGFTKSPISWSSK